MAMLKNKHITFPLILVCLIVVSPMAEAHLPNIQGILFCTTNGAPETASTPAFANANVELQCGKRNTVVSHTTTNTAGLFSISSDDINVMLDTLLSDCKLVVTTPLASCNAGLSADGNLVSKLSAVGTGLLNFVDIVPSGFSLV